MAVRKKRSPAKPKRPVIKNGPDSADIMDEYLRNLYATACAKARNEIAQKMEEAEKLVLDGEKIDLRKLFNDINEEIVLRVMIEKAMENSDTTERLVPKPINPIAIEVGAGLRPLMDPKEGFRLKEICSSVRRHIVIELGIVIPEVKIGENLQLKPNKYVVKIREIEAAAGELMLNHLMAIGPEEKLNCLRGRRTVEPIHGLSGIWISPNQRSNAELLGCTIFDTESVIAMLLTEVELAHASDLLGRMEVLELIDNIRRTHPAVVNDFIPDQISLREVHRVLQNLLRERVSVRDLVTILETIADNVNMSKDPEVLTECVRVALSKVICREYMNNEGVINVITLDPQIEQIVAQSIQRTEMGSFLALDPSMGQEILMSIGQEVGKLQERGLQPIILCAPQIRPALKRLTDRAFPNLVVLSWNEIAPKVNVNSVGTVSIDIPATQREEKDNTSVSVMKDIDVLVLDVMLERWLSSHIVKISGKLELKLDDAAEEILIRAIGRQFRKLESTDGPKTILCSMNIYRVIKWSIWGRLLLETLKERFPMISFTIRKESVEYSRYNIVGTVSLDEDLSPEGFEEAR
ncbi:MAG: FHIPEP family type III secretion protein [Candidatus Xenobiia bacterium LiM19]